MLQHLHGDVHQAHYVDKQESIESTVSDLLLAPSYNYRQRERHESGRSDYRSDYHSEIDTDTEDSRTEDPVFQGSTTEPLSQSQGFSQADISIQGMAEKQEQCISSTGIAPRMTTDEKWSSSDSSDQTDSRRPTVDETFDPGSSTPAEPVAGSSCKEEQTDNVQEETGLSDLDTSFESSNGAECSVLPKQEAVVDCAGHNQEQVCGSEPVSHTFPSVSVLEAEGSRKRGSESEGERDSGVDEASASASLSHNSRSLNTSNQDPAPSDSLLVVEGSSVCVEETSSGSVAVSESEPSESLGSEILERTQHSSVDDSGVGEVESSTENFSSHRQRHSTLQEHHVSPDNSESAVSSHSDAAAHSVAHSPVSTVLLPLQAEAPVASGSGECGRRSDPHSLGDPDEEAVSSLIDSGTLSTRHDQHQDAAVTSQVDAPPANSAREAMSEQADIGGPTMEPCVDSSNKETESVVSGSKPVHHTHTETQVSCSSDSTHGPSAAAVHEAEASTSTSVVLESMDTDNELEEGEWVSDTEQVSSAAVEQAAADAISVGSEVSSSSHQERVEEEAMEVDSPDQSAVPNSGGCSDLQRVDAHCRTVSAGATSSAPMSNAAAGTANSTTQSLADTNCNSSQQPHSLTLHSSSSCIKEHEQVIDSTSGSGLMSSSEQAADEGVQQTGLANRPARSISYNCSKQIAQGSTICDVSSTSMPSFTRRGSLCSDLTVGVGGSMDSRDEEPTPSTSSPEDEYSRAPAVVQTRVTWPWQAQQWVLFIQTRSWKLPALPQTSSPSPSVVRATPAAASHHPHPHCRPLWEPLHPQHQCRH